MSEKCEHHPQCDGISGLHESVAEHIQQHGQSVIGVFGDADGPTFSYTIGNHERGLPEIIIFGLDPSSDAQPMLNWLCEKQRERGHAFAHGELFKEDGMKCAIKFVSCSGPAVREYCVQAWDYYNVAPESFDVIQMVVPDHHGRFPGEAGCEAPYKDMPLLTHWGLQ